MNYLLDTCTLSDFFKKIPNVVSNFEKVSPKQVHISTLTIMEIEYGLRLNAEREVKIRPIWQLILKNIQTVPYSASCAASTGYLRAYLRDKGTPIGPYDILIAGTALAHNMVVVTSNFHEFDRLPGLKVENWRAMVAVKSIS